MPPTRIREAGPSSSSTQHKSKKPHKSRRLRSDFNESTAASLPGVQKLKSQLRQTRRLLAKDNLAADVRVGTERRLKALEADLKNAEMSKKERAMAVRYHKVKFFERQKVVRKIEQKKKRLSSEETSESSRKELQSALMDLRVDLNYILHYPKLQKYVSLFPPEIRQEEQDTIPTSEVETEKAKTHARRAELRMSMRRKMERGELSTEPELHMDPKQRHRREKEVEGLESGGKEKPRGRTEAKVGQEKDRKSAGEAQVADDDFFGDDNGDSDGDEVEEDDEDAVMEDAAES